MGVILCGQAGVRAAAIPQKSAAAISRKAFFHRLRQVVRAARWDTAYGMIAARCRRAPQDALLRAARQILARRDLAWHLQQGQALRRAGHRWRAALQFREALAVDPQSRTARAALQAAMPAAFRMTPLPGRWLPLWVRNARAPVRLEFSVRRHNFHFYGPAWTLLHQVAAAYGLRATLDRNTPNPPVRFYLGQARFGQAMLALRDQLGIAWAALSRHVIYFGPLGNAAHFTPLAERTLYLRQVRNARQIAQVGHLLGLNSLQYNPAVNALTLRGAPLQLDAAELALAGLSRRRPEALLQVRILEITHSQAVQLGMQPPGQFQVFSLGPLLAQLGKSGNLQSLLQQLLASGGLNNLSSGSQIAAELQQLEQQLQPLLQTPFALFGGGATLMALTLPPVHGSFARQGSRANDLEDAWLRVSSGQKAMMRIGERYPILNATFSPIYLNSAVSNVLSNGSYIPPVPSFTYINLGVNLKMQAWVEGGENGAGRIYLHFNGHVRTLTGASVNNIPILNDRVLSTGISLRNGEPVLVGGLLDQQVSQQLQGTPGWATLPGLGIFASQTQSSLSQDRFVVEITPHILSAGPHSPPAVVLPPGTASASASGSFYIPAAPHPAPPPPHPPLPNQPYGNMRLPANS